MWLVVTKMHISFSPRVCGDLGSHFDQLVESSVEARGLSEAGMHVYYIELPLVHAWSVHYIYISPSSMQAS